jgi:hypothetical protein
MQRIAWTTSDHRFPSPQLFQYRQRVTHRSDPKRAFLVQQQISELGPADAHRVLQQS